MPPSDQAQITGAARLEWGAPTPLGACVVVNTDARLGACQFSGVQK